jgi:rSAM/selenodomain-associated transferase 1
VAARGPAVLVFVRAPLLGTVKTRLAATLGDQAALRIYRRLAEHAVLQAAALPGASIRIHHTPADAGDDVRRWLAADAAYLPQDPGDLGDRLRTAFGQAFAAGHAPVVVIGSDLPDLTTAHLHDALAALDVADAVIGPARDGGYWLLSLRRPLDGVFDGIPWSTDTVFAHTLHRLRAAGVEPAIIDELADVDEAADLPPGWGDWAMGESGDTGAV